MPTDQEIVDIFALLITGQAQLPQGDPRAALIAISNICLEQFVAMTRYGYEKGLLQEAPHNGFEPQFARPEDNGQ